MDCKRVEKTIVSFIKNSVELAGLKDAVVGLSGGIDSSLVAALAVNSLGKEFVHGLIMPYKTSAKENISDAQELAQNLEIPYKILEITDMVDSYFKYYPKAKLIRKGNLMARCRMSILYDHSTLYKALVLGTGNKTELYLGYFTKYGDGGVDNEPIGNLYKKEVRELAHYLNIPEKIILKTPTADLWEGQTDESEMGLTYNEADEILYLLIDKQYKSDQIVSQGYSKESVERVMLLIENSHHKRKIPLTC